MFLQLPYEMRKYGLEPLIKAIKMLGGHAALYLEEDLVISKSPLTAAKVAGIVDEELGGLDPPPDPADVNTLA